MVCCAVAKCSCVWYVSVMLVEQGTILNEAVASHQQKSHILR